MRRLFGQVGRKIVNVFGQPGGREDGEGEVDWAGRCLGVVGGEVGGGVDRSRWAGTGKSATGCFGGVLGGECGR